MGLGGERRTVPELRVIDFGRVSALRSQTLWHALAYGVSGGGAAHAVVHAPVAALRRARLPPAHGGGRPRRLRRKRACRSSAGWWAAESSTSTSTSSSSRSACRSPRFPGRGKRRSAGCSSRRWPPSGRAGVPAELDDDGEIVVGEAKICGHGAAQIDDAVVVVGNLIERFDHAAAARVLALPDDVRAEVDPADGTVRARHTGRFGRLPGRGHHGVRRGPRARARARQVVGLRAGAAVRARREIPVSGLARGSAAGRLRSARRSRSAPVCTSTGRVEREGVGA